MSKSICPICEERFSDVLSHILSTDDQAHADIIASVHEVIDALVNTRTYVGEVVEILKAKDPRFWFVTYGFVANYVKKKIGSDRVHGFLDSAKEKQPTPEFLATMEESVEDLKALWIPGSYAKVLSQILSATSANPTAYLSHFQDLSFCSICGSNKDVRATFVDEDSQNILISNMEPLCSDCKSLEILEGVLPFATISKDFSFAGAHKLPDYDGDCNFLHGHEWKFTVSVRKRINPITGMIIDFKKLKAIVNANIVDLLDHSYLNDFFPNPTAENIVVWMWERLMFDGLLKGLESIRLWESPTSFITLTKQDMLSVFGRM